jgi:single-stranded DNA-binding protein
VNDYRGDGETAVCWFKCTLWGDHAENIHQWIVQGKELIIQGRLTADEYGNPPTYESNDGDTRASFNLTVDRLNFAGSRGDSSEDVDDEEEDEIPF